MELFIYMILALILNILLSRSITISLIKNKYIKKYENKNSKIKTVQYDKALMLWWFPLIGFLGLLFYLIWNKSIDYAKQLHKWLFLNYKF